MVVAVPLPAGSVPEGATVVGAGLAVEGPDAVAITEEAEVAAAFSFELACGVGVVSAEADGSEAGVELGDEGVVVVEASGVVVGMGAVVVLEVTGDPLEPGVVERPHLAPAALKVAP